MLSRPIAVTVVAAFLFLATAIAAVVGIALLFPGPLGDRIWELNEPGAQFFHSLGQSSGLLLLALACRTFSAAIGLLRGRRWAWWFAVVLLAVQVCGDLAGYFVIYDAIRAVLGVGVSLIFLCLLALRPVRDYFLRRLPSDHRPHGANH